MLWLWSWNPPVTVGSGKTFAVTILAWMDWLLSCNLWHHLGLKGSIDIATDCIWIDRLLSLDTLPSVVSRSWINCSHWILRHWLSLAFIGYPGIGHDWIACSMTWSEFTDTSAWHWFDYGYISGTGWVYWLDCCYSSVWDLPVWMARLLTIHCLALVGSEMVYCSHCILLHLFVWMAWFLALQFLVIIRCRWLDCRHYTSWNSLSPSVPIIVIAFSGICWSAWLNYGHFAPVSGISLRESGTFDESIAVTGSCSISLVWVDCWLKLHSLAFVGCRDCCCCTVWRLLLEVTRCI